MRRLAFALLLAIFAFVAAPAMAGPWLKAETPHLVIYSDTGAGELRAYARMLEDYDAALRAFYDRPVDEPAPTKFNLYLVSSPADFRRVFPDARKAIAGMYSVSYEDIFAVAVRAERGWLTPLTGDHTVMHEYAHHFMHQYLQNAYPAWYVEGYAEYFAPTELGRTVTVGAIDAGRAYGLAHDAWIPITDLLTRSAGELPNRNVGAYYGEAWLLTHYIMDDPARRQDFERYLSAWRGGADPAMAWTAAFGETPQALEETLRAYGQGPMRGRSIRRTWAAPAVTITVLSPGAGAILLENQFLKRDTRLSANAAAPIEAAALRYPHDPFVQRALARVRLAAGDRAGGEAVLRALVEHDQSDAETLRLLAVSEMSGAGKDAKSRRAAYGEAKSLMARALKADPNGWQTLYRYAQSRSYDADYLSDETLGALTKAANLAPQVPGIRITAARSAIARKSPDLARQLLQPLASDQRLEEASQMARGMLEKLP